MYTLQENDNEEQDSKPKAQSHVASKVLNSALLYIKPLQFSQPVKELIELKIKSIPSLTIRCQASITGRRVLEKNLVDSQYFTIASRALSMAPASRWRPFPKKSFSSFFAESFDLLVYENRIVNAKTACDRYALSADNLKELWQKAEQDQNVFMLEEGLYCGRLDISFKNSTQIIYVINGFYPAYKEQFTNSDAVVHCYEVDWDGNFMKWGDFSEKVIGCTDPSKAAEGSIRRELYDNWQELGLSSQPDILNNGVHISASPLEALREKEIWIHKKILDDSFGRALAEQGLSQTLLKEAY